MLDPQARWRAPGLPDEPDYAHDVRELGIREVVGRTVAVVGEGPA